MENQLNKYYNTLRAKHGEIAYGYNDKKEWVKFIFDENKGMFVELSKWEETK